MTYINIVAKRFGINTSPNTLRLHPDTLRHNPDTSMHKRCYAVQDTGIKANF